ncbi:enterochelin ABC transporter substrate-binding protein [Aggregatibacter actinomycetemcomitans]|uniref:Enterochelin ABC transporter substrate-binding protein n=2 Tax=Aggregatibacter actinomycetemcomitans TaxID=714 RepID=A0A5D0EN21_AGGAC|nr:siderophore ABC transporter substrate-binding protein [Aggregatibacter actinomycetemcomitans]AFI86077.1 enterochelin ABC transporter substrate-binding protein [Aggregatibacter actinomycetemcomitans D7S-1]KYK95289.1 enterochelin ABC transporter substrate-binding protein [Aggregatibacter actinomycetemcomitans serotype d str. SA3733]AMQ93172.1 enterochelin ABC transporter substrate-binding protein [Aggregatibacter actinomycetemcomitans]ANU82238.1 enterochelin ABC transporter substrate-binding p
MLKKTLVALTCIAVATSALAKEVTIPTARGEVTLDAPPTKIAVFDTGSLDTLQALGVKVDGAADVGKLLPYLKPTLAQAKNVGTIFEPNLEALNELKPDLIIVGTRTAKKFDDVSAIAKTVDLTDSGDKLVESGIQRIESFGKLFNKQAEADKLKAEIETLFKQTKDAVKGKGNGLIILVNGGKISAFGKGYRLSFIHEDLGVPMADPSINVSGHGQPISFEFIEKTNPDWLFVLDRISAIGQEGKSAKEVLDNELIHHTKAWKNGNIVYLSSASYLAPGGAEQLKMDLNNIKAAFEKK